jgi:hypothetical protein
VLRRFLRGLAGQTMADIATLAMILIDPRSVVVYDLRDHSDPDSRRGAGRRRRCSRRPL